MSSKYLAPIHPLTFYIWRSESMANSRYPSSKNLKIKLKKIIFDTVVNILSIL
jgi:hypothetical protein